MFFTCLDHWSHVFQYSWVVILFFEENHIEVAKFGEPMTHMGSTMDMQSRRDISYNDLTSWRHCVTATFSGWFFHGIQWNPMESNGIQWNPMEFVASKTPQNMFVIYRQVVFQWCSHLMCHLRWWAYVCIYIYTHIHIHQQIMHSLTIFGLIH